MMKTKKTDQQRLKELREKITNLLQERNALADKMNRETVIPEKQKLIGATYKYRNNYSCPEPEEYWWMYVKVLGVDEHGDLSLAEVERDFHGRVLFRHVSISELSVSYIPIPMAEFTAAVVPIIAEIHSVLP